jgi:hypothetical protein
MGREINTDAIRMILRSGDFDQFKGVIETQILECKSVPYRLQEVYQKQELAKDVSGMANASGGFLLLGLATVANPTRAEEEITDIRPIPSGLFDPQQYQDVLKAWTYPAIEGVEIEWFASASDPKKGIGSIAIPPQPPGRGPFLVTRTIDDAGKMVEIVFGYFERRRTSVDAMSVARLQTVIQTGLQFQQFGSQIDTIQQLLEGLTRTAVVSPVRTNSVAEEDMLQRVDQAFVASDLRGKPALALAAMPINATDFPGLFRSRHEAVVQLLEHPPQLRNNGFNLIKDVPAQMVGGTKRRAFVPENALLELWRDGTLIFACRADEHFLSWPPSLDGKIRPVLAINTLALIECAYLFSSLAMKIYQSAEPQPEEMEFTLFLQNMTRERPSTLAVPSSSRPPFLIKLGNAAPEQGLRRTLSVNIKTVTPGVVAFRIAALVFEWYGVEHDRIPFQDPAGVINADLLIEK